jgi:hypothetical protein
MEAVGSASSRNITARVVRQCRELIAVNAVRGARPILALDGHSIGEGRPGRFAAMLAAELDTEHRTS